jgi:hypothetical protein
MQLKLSLLRTQIILKENVGKRLFSHDDTFRDIATTQKRFLDMDNPLCHMLSLEVSYAKVYFIYK